MDAKLPVMSRVSLTLSLSFSVALALLSSCRFGYELILDAPAGGGGELGVEGERNSESSGSSSGSGSSDGGGSTSESGGKGASGDTGGAASGDAASGGTASDGGTATGGQASGGTAAGGSLGMGGLGGQGSASSDSPCEVLHKLSAPPTMNGVLEPGLTLQDFVPEGFRYESGNLPEHQSLPADVSARYAMAWTDNGIYFYIEVTDPELRPAPSSESAYRGDSVELYVDHDADFLLAGFYNDPGTRQFTITSPPSTGGDSTYAEERIPAGTVNLWTGRWISTPTVDGYIVEALISAADLNLDAWTLSAGDRVGIDIAHNVSFPDTVTGDEGNRLGQYFLKVADNPTDAIEDYPFNNSAVFCVTELLDP